MIDTIKAQRIKRNLERLKQLSESEQGARIGEHLEHLSKEERELERHDQEFAAAGFSVEQRLKMREQLKALIAKDKGNE